MSPRKVGFGRVAAIADEEGAIIGLARSSIGDPDDVTTAGRAGSVVWNELLAGDAREAARFYERVFGYSAREVERRGGSYILLNASGSARAVIRITRRHDCGGHGSVRRDHGTAALAAS